jgi:dynein heavy chain 1
MRMLADDDDEVTPAASKGQTSQQPAWMRTLLDRCREWLSQLPTVRYIALWLVV